MMAGPAARSDLAACSARRVAGCDSTPRVAACSTRRVVACSTPWVAAIVRGPRRVGRVVGRGPFASYVAFEPADGAWRRVRRAARRGCGRCTDRPAHPAGAAAGARRHGSGRRWRRDLRRHGGDRPPDRRCRGAPARSPGARDGRPASGRVRLGRGAPCDGRAGSARAAPAHPRGWRRGPPAARRWQRADAARGRRPGRVPGRRPRVGSPGPARGDRRPPPRRAAHHDRLGGPAPPGVRWRGDTRGSHAAAGHLNG